MASFPVPSRAAERATRSPPCRAHNGGMIPGIGQAVRSSVVGLVVGDTPRRESPDVEERAQARGGARPRKAGRTLVERPGCSAGWTKWTDTGTGARLASRSTSTAHAAHEMETTTSSKSRSSKNPSIHVGSGGLAEANEVRLTRQRRRRTTRALRSGIGLEPTPAAGAGQDDVRWPGAAGLT